MLNKEQISEIKGKVLEENNRMPVILGALADHGRFRIFKLLVGRDDVCVTDIAAVLGITISAASQQLRILERTGLVQRQRMGRAVCYKVRNGDPLVQSILKLFQ